MDARWDDRRVQERRVALAPVRVLRVRHRISRIGSTHLAVGRHVVRIPSPDVLCYFLRGCCGGFEGG